MAATEMDQNTSASALLPELKKFWGYDAFRPLQSEAIDCILGRRDSVVVLPTGAGKSLCFQLPATQMAGVAVVVSPLISLMKDQVDSLKAVGIPAASINSSLSVADRREIANDVQNGKIKLLYLAPERLVTEATVNFLKRTQVSFFAIDEAHCISAWGHDFRPEYRDLGMLKQQFPEVGVHGFTATATPRVRRDIAQELQLNSPTTLVGSFDRENLLYRVLPRTDLLQQLRQIIDRHEKQSGVIYCISRKEVEQISGALNGLGYRTRPYHAKLTPQQRVENQDAFIREEIDIIVATVAFGMGIDKSNVRYVIHAGLPKSLEAYQQESGRAGRDGLPSECVLLYSGSDFMVWKRMIDADNPAAHGLLESMYQYAQRPGCRHRGLVEYFGQAFEKQDCGACDFCLGELKPVEDSLVVSQKIISCVHRVNQRFGAGHVADVLAGSKSQKVLQFGHDQVSTYGLLSNIPKKEIRNWIEQLVGGDFLAKTGEYSTLSITPAGQRVLRGEITPRLIHSPESPKAKRQRSTTDGWEGVDRGLFDELAKLRQELAAEQSVPAYVIFHDPTLRVLARQRPSKTESMIGVSGVGEKKLAKYGQAFVDRIAKYCRENNVTMDQPPITDPGATQQSKPTSTKPLALQQACELFDQGLTIEQVAKKLDRAPSTTSGYLTKYIAEKRIVDPSPWTDATLIPIIRKAAAEVGSLERLAPIKELLPGEITYEQIRPVIDCLKVETEDVS